MGFARLAEDLIRSARGKRQGESLSAADKIFCSSIGKNIFSFFYLSLTLITVGGALATWNQPIEVVRVEVRTFS